MSNTLENIKVFLVANGITENIYFNNMFVDDEGIVLRNSSYTPDKYMLIESTDIIVKNPDMTLAESKAQSIQDLIVGSSPKDNLNTITMNGVKYVIKEFRDPQYNELDIQNRHTYIFNVTTSTYR